MTTTRQQRPAEGDYYEVKRVVSKRGTGLSTQYLVIWSGYPREAASWVLYKDLTPEAIRSFDNPTIDDDTIEDNVERLLSKIRDSLRRGSSVYRNFSLEFRHDVFRYFWGGKRQLTFKDFDSPYFDIGFNQYYKTNDGNHDYGVKIDFPIKVRLYIKEARKGYYKDRNGRLQTKNKQFTEMLYVTLNKHNCK